jgi:hypothetical protein
MVKSAELKTKVNAASVEGFLNTVEDDQKRKDCFEIVKIMEQVMNEPPKMWGSSIVGFGNYHYKYSSGREGDWMVTGFSPRKQNLTIYIMAGFDKFEYLLLKLGKFKTSVGCLYIKKLDDVDKTVLRELIAESVKIMKNYFK